MTIHSPSLEQITSEKAASGVYQDDSTASRDMLYCAVADTVRPMNYWCIEVEKLDRTTRQPNGTTTLLLGSQRDCITEREATSLVLNAFLTRGEILPGIWIQARKFCAVEHLASGSISRPPDFCEKDVHMWLSDTPCPT